MVRLVNLDNPTMHYEGQVFWDMVRPGVRLTVLGPRGCVTSTIRKVVEKPTDKVYIATRHSRYLLTEDRAATPMEMEFVPSALN